MKSIVEKAKERIEERNSGNSSESNDVPRFIQGTAPYDPNVRPLPNAEKSDGVKPITTIEGLTEALVKTSWQVKGGQAPMPPSLPAAVQGLVPADAKKELTRIWALWKKAFSEASKYHPDQFNTISREHRAQFRSNPHGEDPRKKGHEHRAIMRKRRLAIYAAFAHRNSDAYFTAIEEAFKPILAAIHDELEHRILQHNQACEELGVPADPLRDYTCCVWARLWLQLSFELREKLATKEEVRMTFASGGDYDRLSFDSQVGKFLTVPEPPDPLSETESK